MRSPFPPQSSPRTDQMGDPLTRAQSRRYLRYVGLAVVLMLAGSLLIRALFLTDSPDLDHVQVSGGEYVLSRRYDDDLSVVADRVRIEPGASVDGSLSILAGDVQIAGTISGDLTIVGERVALLPGASVAGEAAILGEDMTLAGRIGGDLHVTGTRAIFNDVFVAGSVSACVDETQGLSAPAVCDEAARLRPFEALIRLRDGDLEIITGTTFVDDLISLVSTGVFYCGSAALLAAAMPGRIARVQRVWRGRVCWQVGFGLYAVLIGGAALTIVLLSIIPPLGGVLALVGVVASLAAGLLALFGWSAAAVWLGRRLLGRRGLFNRRTPDLRDGTRSVARTAPTAAALIGAIGFVVAFALLLLLPYGELVALIVAFVLSAPLLGAAFLSLWA